MTLVEDDRELAPEEVEHATDWMWGQAVDSFPIFRRVIRDPQGIIWSWWLEDAARKLQAFYKDLVAGKRPKLALMAPPQHGKSWMVTEWRWQRR